MQCFLICVEDQNDIGKNEESRYLFGGEIVVGIGQSKIDGVLKTVHPATPER